MNKLSLLDSQLNGQFTSIRYFQKQFERSTFGSDVSNGVQQTVITSYLWGLNIYNQLQHTNIYAPVKD